MAFQQTGAMTLTDWAKRQDPDGKSASIVEMLSQTNEVLQDMMFVEGNLPTGHRTTVRTGLPAVAWRMLNYGVPQGKATTAQVTDTVGMLEAFSSVDKDLVELSGNYNEFRLSESRAFLEAMNQEMARTVFYGDTDLEPEKFLGLSPRFSDLSADSGENIVDAGGSTAAGNSSIWLVCWSDQTCHGIFPKGSKAGLQHEDLKIETVEDENGDKFRAYQDHWQWKAGLVLRDWRYVVRIANIDVDALVSDTNAPDLLELLIRAHHKLPNPNMGKCAIYANRTVRTMLDTQAQRKNNVQLYIDSAAGKPQTMFWGIPIRTCDAISVTEDPIA